jgi:macrodomain Ter protein organizer (MatP/YcbG family)
MRGLPNQHFRWLYVLRMPRRQAVRMSRGTTKRSIRVDDSLWEEAQAAASERGDNLSDIVRQGLWEYVNNHVEQKDQNADQ